MTFRVVALPDAVASEVRATGRAPRYGHPAYAEVANGYGPCRLCLQPFTEGKERRLLFTYDPFDGLETLPLPGPVFVHEASCSEYAAPDRFPDALRFIPLTLNAYGRGRQLREVVYVQPGEAAEPAIARLLLRTDIDYLHARNTEAGCYMFRIERNDALTA